MDRAFVYTIGAAMTNCCCGTQGIGSTSVPEFIDPVFVKTSPKRSFSVIENERFGLFSPKLGLKIWALGSCRTVMYIEK